MKYIFCLMIPLIFSLSLRAQIDRKRNEEINITSAFKPSIVRTGKIEFRADPPVQDTSGYTFKYSQTPFNFKTVIGPLEVKPLAFKQDTENSDGETLFAKVGYGNLQNPFASLSYTSGKPKKQLSFNLDHISARGNLKHQNYANSSASARFRNLISLNQVFDVFTGYDVNQYRLYGYDHDIAILPEDQVKQQFHHINTGISYQHLAGRDGQILFNPSFRFDYLSTSRQNTESQLTVKLPFALKLSSLLHLKSSVNVTTVQLNNSTNYKSAKTLIQLPFNVDFSGKEFNLNAGILPVLKHDKLSVLPEIQATYSFPETNLKVKAGVHNNLDINSMYKALLINPFVTNIDSLTIFHEQQIYAGFDLHSVKGLQLNVKTGFSRFKNQVLFINKGVFGNEFKFLNESSLDAFVMEANLSYIFSNSIKFSSNLLGYSFQKQQDFDEAYGLLPLELSFRLDWQPIEKIKSRFSTILWSGTMTRAANNTDLKLQDAADISMGIEYLLNKKWGLWIDLNNIANSRYQRWSQYPSFGFNFTAGVRYVFNKND